MSTEPGEQQLFTCLSCSVAFTSAEEQRLHYRSDHHRYNMKRRVASLPPVSAAVFNQKVLDRRLETSIMASSRGSVCEVCSKTYTTENAYRSHINSKKHKENELKAAQKARDSPGPATASADLDEVPSTSNGLVAAPEPEVPKEVPASLSQPVLTVAADATEEDIAKTIDEKIAAARSRLSLTHCLFCSAVSSSLTENLTHMSQAHSFFIPDAQFLVDIEGLVTYLGEKIAIGNVCIYCNSHSREFRTMDAVRKHMLDKSHCKIAYDTQNDRLEVSDYYDFSSSYPDYETKKERKKAKAKAGDGDTEGENVEWEDVEDDGEEADEIVEEHASSAPSSEDEDSDDGDEEDLIPETEFTYGDTPFELVLPSGARIGHRSMKRYYAQSFPRLSLATRNGKEDDPNSGAGLVRRLLADKNSTLIPRKGGFGAFGTGTDVVKARNRGEAREAGRHVREFRDQKRREDFKTRVGYGNNHQKHFRDPLLQ